LNFRRRLELHAAVESFEQFLAESKVLERLRRLVDAFCIPSHFRLNFLPLLFLQTFGFERDIRLVNPVLHTSARS